MNLALRHFTTITPSITHREQWTNPPNGGEKYKLIEVTDPKQRGEFPFEIFKIVGRHTWKRALPVTCYSTLEDANTAFDRIYLEAAMESRETARASAFGLFMHGFDDAGRATMADAGHPEDAEFIARRARAARADLQRMAA